MQEREPTRYDTLRKQLSLFSKLKSTGRILVTDRPGDRSAAVKGASVHRSLFFSVAILLAVIANPGLLRGQSPQLKLDTVRPNRQAVGEQLPDSATRSPDSSANASKRLFDPIDLNNLATQLVTEGRFIEAAAKLEQAIQLSPEIGRAHV